MPSSSSNYSVAVDSIRSALDNFMEAYRIADIVMLKAIELAPTQRIKDAISIEYVRPNPAKSTAKIVVDLQKAPEGRAYEYGSGEHARRGTAQRYPITGNPYLVFNWEAKDRVVKTHQVMHPGVASKPSPDRGYMATALQDTKQQMKDRIQREFGTQVSKSIRIAFKGS
jgi:hypothetical protein